MRAVRRTAILGLALLPYLTPYALHFTRAGAVPTGFLFPDMPYYAANGRAVFERGNGFAYPNAYDPAPNAPAIYFHWPVWLLGFGVVQGGADPGLLFLAIGVVAGFACSLLTRRLAAGVLPSPRFVDWSFLLTMWGGGLLFGAQALRNLALGRPWYDDPLALDAFEGHWCLYWGRNLIYPTEAVYHALVAGVWLAMISARPLVALALAAALAAAHPFTGAETLAVLSAWWVWRCFRRDERRKRAFLGEGALLLLICLAFAAYNFVFLESFAAHRALRKTWALPWNPSTPMQVAAYAPAAALAAARLLDAARGRLPLDDRARFFAVAASVALLLSNHHWFLPPHQPLHFTRGYVWAPLLLFGLPALQRLLTAVAARTPRFSVTIGLGLGLFCASADNAAFLVQTAAVGRDKELYLTRGEWEVLSWLRRHRPRGALASSNLTLAYLSAVYAPTRPYTGHPFNTPDYKRRVEEVGRWLSTGKTEGWLDQVGAVLVEKRRAAPGLDPAYWRISYENDDWRLFERVPPSA